MKSQLKFQAIVIPLAEPDTSGTLDKLALFNPDGSPFSVESGSGPGVVSHAICAGAAGGSEIAAQAPPLEVQEVTGLVGNAHLRYPVDLTGASELRLIVRFDGGSGGGLTASVSIQYSLDDGDTWAFADGDDGPNVVYPGGMDTGTLAYSGWVELTEEAKAEALWRVVTFGGDGTGDLWLTTVVLQVRTITGAIAGSVPSVRHSFIRLEGQGSSGEQRWAEPPAEETEPTRSLPLLRIPLSLEGVNEFRLIMQGDGATEGTLDARIALQYSLDDGDTWAYPDGDDGPRLAVPAEFYAFVIGEWTPLATAAKTYALWRVVSVGGDGTGDMFVMQLHMDVR